MDRSLLRPEQTAWTVVYRRIVSWSSRGSVCRATTPLTGPRCIRKNLASQTAHVTVAIRAGIGQGHPIRILVDHSPNDGSFENEHEPGNDTDREGPRA